MRGIMTALAIAAVVVAAGCQESMIVGVVLPETGEAEDYGASLRTGIRLAFEEAQAAGNVPPGWEVVWVDSGSDPARAAEAADSLYRRGAIMIIGGATSGEALAMLPVAEQYRRVLLSPSASAPGLAGQSIWMFCLFPPDDREADVAARILLEGSQPDTPERRVLVLRDESPYTAGLIPEFTSAAERRGGTVLEAIDVEEEGWEARLDAKLAGRPRPGSAYVAGYGDAILLGIKALRNRNFTGRIVTTSAIYAAGFLREARTLAEGVYFPLVSFDLASTEEPVRSFVLRYTTEFGVAPDIFAAHGYDAALATVNTLQGLARANPRDVQIRLRSIGDIQGVTGSLAFDDNGFIQRFPVSHFIRDGRVENEAAWRARESERIRREMEELLIRRRR